MRRRDASTRTFNTRSIRCLSALRRVSAQRLGLLQQMSLSSGLQSRHFYFPGALALGYTVESQFSTSFLRWRRLRQLPPSPSQHNLSISISEASSGGAPGPTSVAPLTPSSAELLLFTFHRSLLTNAFSAPRHATLQSRSMSHLYLSSRAVYVPLCVREGFLSSCARGDSRIARAGGRATQATMRVPSVRPWVGKTIHVVTSVSEGDSGDRQHFWRYSVCGLVAALFVVGVIDGRFALRRHRSTACYSLHCRTCTMHSAVISVASNLNPTVALMKESEEEDTITPGTAGFFLTEDSNERRDFHVHFCLS